MREGPDHYTRLKPEPIDVIRAWDLPWCTANALKYIARYRNKGGVEDLKKARHYLDLEIEAMDKTDREARAAKEREGSDAHWAMARWMSGKVIY